MVAGALLRGARAVVVCVDVTCAADLEAGIAWVAAARAHAPPGCVVVAVGCGTELADLREVDAEDAAARFAALAPPVPYLEASGATGDGVDALCAALVRTLVAAPPAEPVRPAVPAAVPAVRWVNTNENENIPAEDTETQDSSGACTVC